MSAVASIDVAAHVRQITEDEVADYRRDGWAHLPGLMSAELAARVLAHLENRMGRESRTVARDSHQRTARLDSMWLSYELPSADIPLLHRVAHSEPLARAAQAFIGRDRGVRFWKDELFLKLPTADGGAETGWHQDSPYYPMDRFGSLTIWFALVEVRPASGSLRFMSGSHRLGNLGRSFLDDDPLRYARDELDRLETSPPLHLQPGDATVHHLATVHYAAANQSDSPRWAYTCGYFPADARYTGAPQRFTDGLGLTVGETFEHPRFPLLVEPLVPAES